MGQDLALVGVGLRSNVEACEQLMERDLLGTRRLGVVRDDYDRHQVRMHLCRACRGERGVEGEREGREGHNKHLFYVLWTRGVSSCFVRRCYDGPALVSCILPTQADCCSLTFLTLHMPHLCLSAIHCPPPHPNPPPPTLQDRMHLDCVFSVLGEKVCIMLETIIGEDSSKRRLVDEYVRDGKTGKYTLQR